MSKECANMEHFYNILFLYSFFKKKKEVLCLTKGNNYLTQGKSGKFFRHKEKAHHKGAPLILTVILVMHFHPASFRGNQFLALIEGHQQYPS